MKAPTSRRSASLSFRRRSARSVTTPGARDECAHEHVGSDQRALKGGVRPEHEIECPDGQGRQRRGGNRSPTLAETRRVAVTPRGAELQVGEAKETALSAELRATARKRTRGHASSGSHGARPGAQKDDREDQQRDRREAEVWAAPSAASGRAQRASTIRKRARKASAPAAAPAKKSQLAMSAAEGARRIAAQQPSGKRNHANRDGTQRRTGQPADRARASTPLSQSVIASSLGAGARP